MELEQAIRERAYFIWLDSDCAHGNADAHWLAAEIELTAEVEEAEVIAASMETVAQLMSSSEAAQTSRSLPCQRPSVALSASVAPAVAGAIKRHPLRARVTSVRRAPEHP